MKPVEWTMKLLKNVLERKEVLGSTAHAETFQDPEFMPKSVSNKNNITFSAKKSLTVSRIS